MLLTERLAASVPARNILVLRSPYAWARRKDFFLSQPMDRGIRQNTFQFGQVRTRHCDIKRQLVNVVLLDALEQPRRAVKILQI